MTDEAFRTGLLLVMAPFVPVAVYHRIRSNLSGERLDRWQEGPCVLFGLRLSGLPWFVATIAWLSQPERMAWSKLPLAESLRWFGLSLVLLWGLLVAWTFHHLGHNLTDTVVTRKNHTLVTSGPYRYVRHPFYLSLVIGLIGLSLVAANWFLFLSACLPCGFLAVRTPIEEAKLVERFGDEYREYMTRTHRYLPRWQKG